MRHSGSRARAYGKTALLHSNQRSTTQPRISNAAYYTYTFRGMEREAMLSLNYHW